MKSRLEEKEQDLSYRHINLEMSIRQSSGHVEQTVGYDSLEFRGNEWAGDQHRNGD